MALKIELGADKERGPGFGRLRIEGAAVGAGPLQVSIQSNQKGQFLAADGAWQNAEAWHDLYASADGAGVVVAVGPELVDPIVNLPPNCVLRMKIKDINDFGGVTVRGLLHSAASGARPQDESSRVEHRVEPVAPSAAQTPPFGDIGLTASEEDRPMLSSAGGESAGKGQGKLFAIIGAAVLVLALAGAAAYFMFGRHDAVAVDPPQEGSVAVDKPAATQAPAVAAPSEINSREDVARFIQSNPTSDAAVAAAGKLAGGGKLDLSMLVYQYAARAGSADASVALAHIYDPQTWTAKTSPMPQADAETAAYWYEPAAQSGNVEAQRRLGQILVEMNPSGFQRDKGKEWLGKAAAAGDAKAKAALDAAK